MHPLRVKEVKTIMAEANKKPQAGELQQRFINAEIRAKSEDSRTMELSFSSELPVDRWYGQEILCHDAECVDLQRLTDVGVVLFSHGRDANYGKMPVAKIEKVWLDEKERKCRAEITFDTDEDSEKVYQKTKNGFIKGVSFGYIVNNWEEVEAGKKSTNGRFQGPAYIGLRWEPYEISIEPCPADPSVGVGRAVEQTKNGPESQEKEEKTYKNANLLKKLELKMKECD